MDKCPDVADLTGNLERPPLNEGEMMLDSIRQHGFCPHCHNFDRALDLGVDFNRVITAAIKWVEGGNA